MSAAPILTLEPAEISRFLVRQQRRWALEQDAPQLDAFLTEILAKANEFVPSEAGFLLLDDPRAKNRADAINTLTFIACFGPQAARLLGRKIPISEGTIGLVYTTGQPYRRDEISPEQLIATIMGSAAGARGYGAIAVPIIVRASICGVLGLLNPQEDRSKGGYTSGQLTLLQTFAGYISSSIQNALDAIRAREAARRDDLTGLYNDRFLHQRLASALPEVERDGLPLSLLFLDLDHFKAVNDRYGHLVGSRTLKEVGFLLERWTPPGAVAARYGGDEFVIILPGYDSERAATAAERLRETIAAARHAVVPGDEGEELLPLQGSVTASIGVASLAEHVAPQGSVTRRQNALIRLADQAMYAAKSAGRNRVIIAAPERVLPAGRDGPADP